MQSLCRLSYALCGLAFLSLDSCVVGANDSQPTGEVVAARDSELTDEVAAASDSGPSGEAALQATCAPPAAPPLVGWAAVSGMGVSTTTGGGNATPITVTSYSALQSAVSGSGAKVVYVQGSLGPGKLTVGSNKTIVGLCGAEIKGHVDFKGASNVIVRNVKVTGYAVGNCALDPDYKSSVGCSSGNDTITVQNSSHHIWFDHLDVNNGADGNLDITNGSDFITVSWTKFSYAPRTDNSGSDSTGSSGHRFSNLVGGSDSTTSDRGHLNVTWHHDYWADNVVERQARVRFGKNHFFNNVWASKTTNYDVRAGKESSLYIENGYFDTQKNPHEFNSSTDQGTAYITAVNNTYSSVSGSKSTGGGGTPFTPSKFYSYSSVLTSAAQARTDVLAGAGPH